MAGGGGGTITERGLTAAFKRAKQSGVFIVQNQNLAKYPMELCDFVNFTVEGENWWDGSELVRIDMSLNKLESIPEEVHQQNTVQHFNLTGNLIKAIPDTLFKMEALKILDISNNQISVLSDALGEAKALRELQAKGNQIARIPDSIVELQALELLDVSQNKLTALPSTIGSLPRLFKLNLDENQLTVIPACFAGLQALTDLSMAKNKIAAVEEDALAPLSNLCMLELHQNCFSGYFSSVPKSEKLDRLSLAFNQLQGLENVDRAPNLTLLDLHSNKIQTLPDSLCTMYKLQALKISNNDLSDINPRISLLDSLVRMNIEG
ncbi:MAG: leucine-rich repeat domain-containing protein, partial [Promethearchaeia archaeon]